MAKRLAKSNPAIRSSHQLSALETMNTNTRITIEGYTAEEILALPDETLKSLVVCGEAVVFKAGTAEILGKFQVADRNLIVELAHIDGGGEGVLLTISNIANRYAQRRSLANVEWRVHAIRCANPNLKLRRVLDRRGFQIRDVPGSGECYHLVSPVHKNGG